MMEVEKPFKCTTCLARFTNEDHLQIHRRRHEMFLSFNSTSSSSRPSTAGVGAGEMSFVDVETPTPTRFFRIGDEIGLFQDIQHVNPFDEQFSQEVQSPSRRDLHLFDSRQQSPVTSGVLDDNDNNNMNYNQQPDVLNTPQVLDMALSMASQFQLRNTTSLITTTTTMSTTSFERTSPSPSPTPLPIQPMVTVTTDNEVNHKEGFKDNNNFIEKKRKRARLTLNLPSSPSSASDPCKSSSSVVSVIVENKSLKTNKTTNIISPPLPPLQVQLPASIPAPANIVDVENNIKKYNSIKAKDHHKVEEDKKIELLERNRAAASRSRKRRNIWINELEQRCLKLQSELSQVRNENVVLKKQLSLHSHCDVTKSQNTSTNTNANTVKEVIDLTTSETLSNSDINKNVTKISFVNKPKRGRPRKGNVLFSKEIDILVSGQQDVDPLSSLPASAQKTVEVSKAKIAIPRLEKRQISSSNHKSQPQSNVILNLTMDLSKNGPTIMLNNCRSEK